MPRSALAVCLFALLTSAVFATASMAQEPPEPSSTAVELSKLVVQHSEFRAYVEGLVRSELDPRMSSDFGVAYLERSDVIWSTLQADLATALAAGRSDEELEAMLAGFQESAEEAWRKSAETYRSEVEALVDDETESRRQMGIFGCAAGILNPNLEKARAQAGGDITYDDELFGKLEPILRSTEETCACVLDKTAEKFGDQFLTDPAAAGEEPKLYLQGLLTSGECPNPFAGLPQDG